MPAGRTPTVNDHLILMSKNMEDHKAAYAAFLAAAQTFRWENAAKAQLEASAHLDIAMDEFIAACRLQEKGDGR